MDAHSYLTHHLSDNKNLLEYYFLVDGKVRNNKLVRDKRDLQSQRQGVGNSVGQLDLWRLGKRQEKPYSLVQADSCFIEYHSQNLLLSSHQSIVIIHL